MKPENAHFKKLDFWKQNECESLEDVLDFARCLEDTACPVLTEFYGWDGSEEEPLPSVEEMKKHPKFNSTEKSDNCPQTGWMMAEIGLPFIAKYFDKETFGEYAFTYYSGLDMDIYCDDHPVEIYSYMGGRFDLGVNFDDKKHYVFLRVDSPNNSPICDITSRYYLKGLNDANEKITNLARSLRAGCHLLSKENRRDNLYLQGEVDINNSKLTDEERVVFEKCLIDTADFVKAELFNDKVLECVEEALEMLNPVKEYAKRFTIHFIGHSHIDLAWKWRYPETIECMKGTFETQLELMEREPTYVYAETSAVLWRDMMKKYPEFWEKIRAAAERGQFEPQGGMWCETDGQCVGAESWFRQIENGQRAAMETCGKKSTCAVNIDAFGFNAGLPKILKNAGLNYFITQKLRYNEYTIFPYIHFWWEGDDGSRVLGLHEYPAHSNHIEIDELPKIVCRHHLTDGFYHIPIIWGYGNHGGGPLPVMMDRIDELKKQTVFPNIEFCGFTKFYETLEKEEDLSNIPVLTGELFLETHHKTYTVQAKTKFLNRECERRLLNSESLQAATKQFTDLTPAWEKQLFAQFHDVLAGTSMLKVYRDLYEDYDEAFEIIDNANEKCEKVALGDGKEKYVFNPTSCKINVPVILDKEMSKESGLVKDVNGNKHPFQKTADGKTAIYVESFLPYSFEKFEECDDKADNKFVVTENSVDNGVIKVEFNKENGTISSLIYDGKEFCNGAIGQFKILEDTKSRDYDSWNLGLTGKEWDAHFDSFELIENGPARIVFRSQYSFVIWKEKKPYYGTYLWHTPGVEFPTSFFTEDYIIYPNDPMIRCVLNADWWEDRKDLKLSAETAISNPHAFYQVPFGRLERPVKRETAYEKGRFEVPAQTYADIVGDGYGFALLNRSKHGYDTLDSRIRLTLLTSPNNPDLGKVPDSTADRGRHTIEYAFLPHKENEDFEQKALEYERGLVYLNGSEKVNVELGKSVLKASTDDKLITSARLMDEQKIKYRVVLKDKKLETETE